MKERPWVLFQIHCNIFLGLLLLWARPGLSLPADGTLGQMFLGALGNNVFEKIEHIQLLETGLNQKNLKYAEPQRIIKEHLEKEMLQQMFSLQGFHFGQKKKSSNIIDEEKRKWIKEFLVILNILRSRMPPPPGRLWKRAMIGGGSWG